MSSDPKTFFFSIFYVSFSLFSFFFLFLDFNFLLGLVIIDRWTTGIEVPINNNEASTRSHVSSDPKLFFFSIFLSFSFSFFLFMCLCVFFLCVVTLFFLLRLVIIDRWTTGIEVLINNNEASARTPSSPSQNNLVSLSSLFFLSPFFSFSLLLFSLSLCLVL